MEKRNLEVYSFSLFSNEDLKTKVDYCDVFGKDLFELLKNDIVSFFDSLGPDQLDRKTINIDSIDNKPIIKTNSTLRLITGKIKIGDDDGKEQDFTKAGKKANLNIYNKLINKTFIYNITGYSPTIDLIDINGDGKEELFMYEVKDDYLGKEYSLKIYEIDQE